MEKSRNQVKVIRKEDISSNSISVVDTSKDLSFNQDGSVVVTIPSTVFYIGPVHNP